jgi:hypothetical protein
LHFFLEVIDKIERSDVFDKKRTNHTVKNSYIGGFIAAPPAKSSQTPANC